MLPLTDLTDIRADYRYHAAEMATSPCFEEWALGVAGDPEVLDRLASLPAGKQQANLVFAAARWHGLEPGPYADLRALLLGPDWPAVRATILERRTQTNEVGRLTALLPALALLGDEPLALVELGASAGLCLYPDRYDYSWKGVGELRGSGGPLLTTQASGPLPVPTTHPRVVGRIGVDLAPLAVTSEEDVAWLLTLVWPGQDHRLRRLSAAVDVARTEPPVLITGDMLDRLDEAIALAESCGGVPVVQHSAAVAYLDAPARAAFASRMSSLVAAGRCHWVSLEGARVLPELATVAPESGHPFCLAVDGRQVAWATGHGADLTWL